jgi:hypothetical protein
LFQPYELDFQQAILLDRCWGTLKKCRVADAVKVIKTWVNGWATSYRYHEGVLLPCLFGCTDCKDELRHYFNCPHLFALWSFLADNVSSDPLVRWGLIRPEPDEFLPIVCVFSGYHAIRREFKRKSDFFINNQSVLTGPQIRVAWTVFAEAFFVEAREVTLNCRRFSVPSFLSFLNHEPEKPDTYMRRVSGPLQVGTLALHDFDNSENEGRTAPSYTVAVRPDVT